MCKCPDLAYSIFWFIIWLFLTWPAAFIIAIIEVFFVPFCACIDQAKHICEVLDKVFKILAYQPIENMIYARPICHQNTLSGPQKEAVPTEENV